MSTLMLEILCVVVDAVAQWRLQRARGLMRSVWPERQEWVVLSSSDWASFLYMAARAYHSGGAQLSSSLGRHLCTQILSYALQRRCEVVEYRVSWMHLPGYPFKFTGILI